jgi:hypothetical protein
MTLPAENIVGRIFSVPLIRGGYAFGFVTYYDKATMILADIFDHVADTPNVPEGVEKMPIALKDYIIGGGEFIKMKGNPGPLWTFSDQWMPAPVAPHNKYFIMGSPPLSKIVDIFDETGDRKATEEEVRRFPRMKFAFAPMSTKVLEKHVRHLDIDPKEI